MNAILPVTGPVSQTPPPTALVPNGSPAGNSGPSFGDVLDAINPLQHIPILSGLYRAATGSQISAGSQIAGDTLYGALLPGGAIMGFASSVADVAVKETTGSDIGQYVMNAITPSAPSAPQGAATQAGGVPIATAAPGHLPAPLLHISHDTQASNAQYERAQAFDALNSRLVKMAV